jgi:hypothetical protein
VRGMLNNNNNNNNNNNKTMEKFEEMARKKLGGEPRKQRKLISAYELADKINAEKDIDKYRKLEKFIDIGFEKIFGVKRNDSKTKAKIVQKWQEIRKYSL